MGGARERRGRAVQLEGAKRTIIDHRGGGVGQQMLIAGAYRPLYQLCVRTRRVHNEITCVLCLFDNCVFVL